MDSRSARAPCMQLFSLPPKGASSCLLVPIYLASCAPVLPVDPVKERLNKFFFFKKKQMFSASATAHSQILTKFSAHKLKKKIEEKLRKRLKEIKKAKFRLLNKLTAHFFCSSKNAKALFCQYKTSKTE